jgi:type III secretion system YscQ/HrcQ family protein
LNVTPVDLWSTFDFGTLPSFSRRQVRSWNALRRAFGDRAGWQVWIADGLDGFFESPAGYEIRLRRSHSIDRLQPEVVFTSSADEISVGREPSCDVQLAPRSIGNRHARIFIQAGQCYIEDLGSAIGTFLNEVRLPANQPSPVMTGDQFAIFPYTFSVEITERWVRGAPVDVCAGPVMPACGSASTTDHVLSEICVEPAGAVFLLHASRVFLERLSTRLLAPLCTDLRPRLGLTPADTFFYELLAAAVLERINRDLPFPLQLTLTPASSAPDEGSLSFAFSLRVGDLTGAFRVSMRDDAMASLAASGAPPAQLIMPDLSWAFPVSGGYVELSTAELAQIEPGDVVLLTRQSALLFPNSPAQGWHLVTAPGNLCQTGIDKYFEGVRLNDRETQPDLAGLPVRMHVIIGEKVMTLAEVSTLTAGAIVELDEIKSASVRITLNGRTSGAGELVEVDGRMGVRILTWGTP